VSPDIPTTDPKGWQGKLTPGVYWQAEISPQWISSVRAAYDIGPKAYWSQAKLAYQPDWRWQIGPVLTAAGGVNYRSRNAGVFFQANLGHGISLTPELGVSAQPNQPTRAYASLSASSLF